MGSVVQRAHVTVTQPLHGTFIVHSDREPIQFTIQADPGVSAGIAGASVGAAGIGTQVIEIDMTPFSPFAGEADVRERSAGFPEARFEDKGDGFAIEWSARKVRN